MYQAQVEFGVGGYRYFEGQYQGETLDDLRADIWAAYDRLVRDVERQVAEDGDLREYCPEFANGYPLYEGPEEDICVTVTGLQQIEAKEILTPDFVQRWDEMWAKLVEEGGWNTVDKGGVTKGE